MSVVAVVNRKGGAGKSTLAVHLAAYCAMHHRPVLLGDTDPNQSTQVWHRLRALRLAGRAGAITTRALDPRSALRLPAGTQHVVLDTEGGLRGLSLSRIVSQADVLLIPVCHALFDREAAAACWAELRLHPRVANGQCRVAAVGMRLADGPPGEAKLRDWAAAQGLTFIGALRDSRCYARCAERGLTLFDLAPHKVASELAQWAPIIEWLTPLWLHKPAHPERLPARSDDPRIHRPVDKLASIEPEPAQCSAISAGQPGTAVQPASAAAAAGPGPAGAPPPARGAHAMHGQAGGAPRPATAQQQTWLQRLGRWLPGRQPAASAPRAG